MHLYTLLIYVLRCPFRGGTVMSRYILILPKGGSERNVGWFVERESACRRKRGFSIPLPYGTILSKLSKTTFTPFGSPPKIQFDDVHSHNGPSRGGPSVPCSLPFDIRADTFSAARGLVKIHYPFVRILFPVREGIREGSRAVEAPVAFLSLGRLDGGWRRS